MKFKLWEEDLKRPKAIFICGIAALIIGLGIFLTHNKPLGLSLSIAKEIPKAVPDNLSTAQINSEIRDLLQKNNLRAAQNKTPAPYFELRDQNGRMVRLSQFRGETVLLGFFTTW
jgi:cytochrome oxidase Cu insertion factor (SCO1/SenC/PrrC family)